VTSPRDAVHPDAVTLAGYIDRRLPEGERRGVAEHLISCGACRESVMDVSRVTRAERTRRRAIGGATAVTGIAAALVLLALPRNPPVAASGSFVLPVERAAPIGTLASIRVWGPDTLPGARVAPVTFAWAPIATGAQYRLSLTDASGEERWTASTSDTSVISPTTIDLAPDATYYWVVDALLPDGATASSGIRRLPRSP
jgi:hypothetical protein